jgi:hypothetical protein
MQRFVHTVKDKKTKDSRSVCEDLRALKMGGSGKRKLADGPHILRNTVGKLRRLRLRTPNAMNRAWEPLPLPPVASVSIGPA